MKRDKVNPFGAVRIAGTFCHWSTLLVGTETHDTSRSLSLP